MPRETRTLLGDTEIRSILTRMLAQSCFPKVAEVGAKLDQVSFDSIKTTDFSLQVGSASCRVVTSDGNNVGVRLWANTLEAAQWDQLIELLSEKAYFAAQLLAGKLPIEIVELAKINGIPLIPIESVGIEEDTVELSEPSIAAAALITRLGFVLENDPTQFFLFRGKSPQEVIAELRSLRLAKTSQRRRPTAITELSYEDIQQNTASIEDFWKMSNEIKELSYTIKADELPASILKWLAPMPLGGLEDKIDFIVEEGYARIARLAQGFGLGL